MQGASIMSRSGGEKRGCLLEIFDDIQTQQELVEFDFEKEFDLVLNSALNDNHLEMVHYVNRTRSMRLNDPNNFYTLAAETVVACFSNGRRKIDKYHSIILHLKKARRAANENLDKHFEVMERIQGLADSIVDIFDYSI